jgi:hypothetical protein
VWALYVSIIGKTKKKWTLNHKFFHAPQDTISNAKEKYSYGLKQHFAELSIQTAEVNE